MTTHADGIADAVGWLRNEARTRTEKADRYAPWPKQAEGYEDEARLIHALADGLEGAFPVAAPARCPRCNGVPDSNGLCFCPAAPAPERVEPRFGLIDSTLVPIGEVVAALEDSARAAEGAALQEDCDPDSQRAHRWTGDELRRVARRLRAAARDMAPLSAAPKPATVAGALLLDCPFCGSVANYYDGSEGGLQTVSCTYCDATIAGVLKGGGPLERWNRRPTPPAPPTASQPDDGVERG